MTAMADRLGVRLLGDFRLDGADLAVLRSRQARTLLKRLAIARGATVDADSLTEAVWPDKRPAQPERDLHVLVSRARAVVGTERIERRDLGYALLADWWDVVELDVLAREAVRRADDGDLVGAGMAADGALALVRGDLLADERDATWAEAEREATHRTVVGVLDVAAGAALESGRLGNAVTHATEALRLDPFHEGALRTLMRAHAAAGRPAAALAEFARVSELLAEELGVDPGPATRAVHEAILREEPTGPVRPDPVTPLAGRDHEVAVLDEELARARTAPRVVVVGGEPGLGKTVLLDHWATSAEARGVVVVRGHGRAVGLGLQPVVDALGARGADLGPVDRAHIEGLPGPGATPDALTEALFGRLDDAVRSLPDDAGVALVIDDADALDALSWTWLARIRRRGAPAVLVVVALRDPATAALTPDATVHLSPVDEHGGDGLEGAVTRWRGSGAAAATLQAAAVLGATVDLELLAATVSRSPLDVLEHLDTGFGQDLLVEREGRFAFRHETVRLALAGEAGPARRAWLHRRASAVLQARPDADPLELARHAREGGDAEVAAAALARAADLARARFDLAGAEAFLDEALALRDDTAVRLQRSRVRMSRGDLDGADADAVAAMATDETGEALELRAWVARNRHDLDGAVRLGRAAAEKATDPSIRGSSLIAAAFGHRGRGDLKRADSVLQEAEGSPSELGLPAWTGVLRVHQGRPAEALATLEPMLGADARRGSQGFWVEHTLQMTAHAYGLLGRSADALRVLDRLEVELERRGTGVRYAGVQHTYRSWVLRNLGDPSALDIAEAGLAMAGSQEILAQCHLDVADCLLRAGDLSGASSRLATAEAESGTRWFHNKWRFDQRRLLLLARVALAEGDATAALEPSEQVVADAEERGDERYAVLGRLVRAVVHGSRADRAQLHLDLAALDGLGALEGWWLAADVADATGSTFARATARRLADHLAREAGDRGEAFRSVARNRLDQDRIGRTTHAVRPFRGRRR